MPKHNPSQERAANWSFEEVKILAEFVKEHTAELFGTRCKASAEVDKRKHDFWKKATEVLKECGGSDRKWDKVRKKWQDVSSHARNYHRDINKTGGGPKPPVNKVFEVVLDAVAAVAKDGIVEQMEGETIPDVETLLGNVEAGITDEAMDLEDLGQDEEIEEEIEEESKEKEDGGQTARGGAKNVNKRFTQQSNIIEIEREKLKLERERLEISKENLKLSRSMADSLKEISHTLQVFMAFTLEKSGW